jgi:hypothetical protein
MIVLCEAEASAVFRGYGYSASDIRGAMSQRVSQ